MGIWDGDLLSLRKSLVLKMSQQIKIYLMCRSTTLSALLDIFLNPAPIGHWDVGVSCICRFVFNSKWRWMESQGIIKVITNYSEGKIYVRSKFHGNPSNNYWATLASKVRLTCWSIPAWYGPVEDILVLECMLSHMHQYENFLTENITQKMVLGVI